MPYARPVLRLRLTALNLRGCGLDASMTPLAPLAPARVAVLRALDSTSGATKCVDFSGQVHCDPARGCQTRGVELTNLALAFTFASAMAAGRGPGTDPASAITARDRAPDASEPPPVVATPAVSSGSGKAPIAVRLKLGGELGALGVAYHSLQFGSNGTRFDLRRDGRQDTMFFFARISTELEIDDHHEIILLYQPLRLRTQTVLERDLVADDETFAAGSGVDLFYGFDFYRISYAYDFLTDLDDEIAIGFSMQFRNFRSSYVSTDGEQAVVNTNFGPVPAFKFRGRHQLKRANFWYGAEVDGFYANLPFINGGDDPVEGLIVDASLRAGVTVAKIVKPFFNVRYLGGGSKGTSNDKVGGGDGFTRNWLHIVAVSLGVEVAIPVTKRDREARDREVAARKAKRKAKRRR